MLAQALLLVQEDMLHEDPDREENIFKFKAVNYIGMIPVTVKAIQEQQVIIENLENKVSALEDEIKQIKALLQSNLNIKTSPKKSSSN